MNLDHVVDAMIAQGCEPVRCRLCGAGKFVVVSADRVKPNAMLLTFRDVGEVVAFKSMYRHGYQCAEHN